MREEENEEALKRHINPFIDFYIVLTLFHICVVIIMWLHLALALLFPFPCTQTCLLGTDANTSAIEECET